MKYSEMEINMNFLDMFDEGLHHGALKEINFNETKDFKQEYTDKALSADFPDKMPGGGDVTSSASRKMRLQRCAAEGCEEVTYKSRTSRSWVCKSHQTRMNKDMLKRRLEERSRTPVSETVVKKKEASSRPPGRTDSPASGSNLPSNFRPSLLEEVLNEKKMSLMRSPEVITFLRGNQKRIEDRKRREMQLKEEPVDTVSSSSSTQSS